jgi:hypothetical protein
MTYAETVDPDGELDNCSFTKGTAATHAIEFDATNTPTTITLRGIDFSGYNAANGNNDSDGGLLQGARVLAEPTSSANFPYQASVSITGTGTTATVSHTGHGLTTNDYVIIKGVENDDDYNGVHQITVTGANAYTYTTTETLGVSPATGTITATYAMISATTDVNGEVTNSWSLVAAQPFKFKVGYSTATSPFYQGVEDVLDTISQTADRDVTIQLVSDE